MKNKIIHHFIWFVIIGFLTNSCVESFEIKTDVFESAIVIEATITNEFKFQEVKLSRTFKFEEGPAKETGANVKIVDSSQNTYSFTERSPGDYFSSVKFSAQPNNEYQLFVTTRDGRNYTSTPTKLTEVSQIDNIQAVRETSDLGVDRVAILVDSYDPTGKSRNYRYEYEETFKIIAPYWSENKAIIVSEDPPTVDVAPKNEEELNSQVCFKTIASNTIIQTQTNDLAEDRVSKFPVRYLTKDNFIISHRYSILVKQYVQSPEAYSFYRILNNLVSSESLFSQTQPGFLSGNILSPDNPNEKVLGFFDVATVSTKRFFFNFSDLFPGESLPPYIEDCYFVYPPVVKATDPTQKPLLDIIKTRTFTFWDRNDNPPPGANSSGPFVMVPVKCGDCTTLGTNITPDFWVE
jgi:Domain of unknown function (DUF4249)